MQKFLLIISLLLSGICIAFSSCEKEIQFKGDEQQPLLVLNGFLTPDSVVQVHLSRSRFILDNRNRQYPIGDATVELYVNGVLTETLSHHGRTDGFYRGTYKPLAQDRIMIRASAPGLHPVKAETVIPRAPVFELADSTLIYIWEDQNSSSSYEIHKLLIQTNNIRLRLNDNPEETNGYFLKVDNTVHYDSINEATFPVEVDLKTILKGNVADDTSDFLEEFLSDERDNSYRKNLFSDNLFNGKSVYLDFQNITPIMLKRYRNGKEIETTYGENENIYTVALSSMSDEYYRFIITSHKAQSLRDDPFSDPVQVTSNVENGAGILGSYTTSKFVFQFKIYYTR